MIIHDPSMPSLSGERFTVVYSLKGDEKEAFSMAHDICFEQTVEFPEELVPEGTIKDYITGKVEEFYRKDENSFHAHISFAVETTAFELTQLLNVIFGNVSLKPGRKVEYIKFSDGLLKIFKGPLFGVSGIRILLGIEGRPILATALKPMGLSSSELASLAYKFAIGGIDIIKDDHGLSDQPFSRFEERVALCSEAVIKANRETGGRCIYVANITAGFTELHKRARFAKDAGAGALMVAPGITGFSAVSYLAEDKSLGLPIISHPAFLGSYVQEGSGISHRALFGQLTRLSGADAVIYPNFGGRFSFSKDECKSIAEGASEPMGNIKPIFLAPGGGMKLEKIPDYMDVYGKDVIYLIGGGLFTHGPDIVENCKFFRGLIQNS
ncbi:MAG TPA: RuBisCO large subunit C-terminal-like domain-containing protein [Clostridia bacterium]